jgi:TonB family protein
MSATRFLRLFALAPAVLGAQVIGGRVVDSASLNPVFFEDQLEKRATGRPESLVLRYPRDLLFGRVSGSVMVKYVISKEGRVEPNSIEILKSSNPRFSESVTTALRRLQFFPAIFQGKPVRQVVHQPFFFCMDSCSGVDSSPNAVSLTAGRAEPASPRPNWARP